MGPPYIAAWHQAPVYTRRALTQLQLQLFSLRRARGKLKCVAGLESGVAAWLNDPLAGENREAAARGWLVRAEKGSSPPAYAQEAAPSRLNLMGEYDDYAQVLPLTRWPLCCWPPAGLTCPTPPAA